MNPIHALSEEQLEEKLRNFTADCAVSSGKFEFPAHCSVNDLDWNHMDQDHRPHIHGTYKNAVRIFTSENGTLSLTTMKFLFLNLSILVTDLKIKKGLFYQSYSILSLFYVHGILTNRENGMTYKWFITSPAWLKFMHSFLSKKIYLLNEVQIEEDIVIRKTRFSLRELGYRFDPDERNYLTANDHCMRTQYPEAPKVSVFDIGALQVGKLTKFKNQNLEILILKNERDFRIWRSRCPHEGGPLEESEICDKSSLICPWHKLKFSGIEISEDNPFCETAGLRFELKEKAIFASRLNF